MRALCGAIVTAGGLIGLGLVAVGYGLRFQTFGHETLHPQTNQLYGSPTLVVIFVTLLISTLIGIGIAFLGLAYHHERRYFELERDRQQGMPKHGTP